MVFSRDPEAEEIEAEYAALDKREVSFFLMNCKHSPIRIIKQRQEHIEKEVDFFFFTGLSQKVGMKRELRKTENENMAALKVNMCVIIIMACKEIQTRF